jgi:uncharacterized protein
MNARCVEQTEVSDNAGDKYYKARARWLTERRTQQSADNCHALAKAYNKTLVKLLFCLRAVKPEKVVEEKINHTLRCKVLLERDFNIGFNL